MPRTHEEMDNGGEMKIEPGFWKTRDGRKARVLCTDAPSLYPVRGYVLSAIGDCYTESWKLDGAANSEERDDRDLIEPWVDAPKTKKVKMAPALCRYTGYHDRYYVTGNLFETESLAKSICDDNFVCWPSHPDDLKEYEVPCE